MKRSKKKISDTAEVPFVPDFTLLERLKNKPTNEEICLIAAALYELSTNRSPESLWERSARLSALRRPL